jgi:hypothetical protein
VIQLPSRHVRITRHDGRRTIGTRPATATIDGPRLEGVRILIAQSLSHLLFGLRPLDPAAFAISTGLLVLVAILAAYWPARQAARVDPVVVLRRDYAET